MSIHAATKVSLGNFVSVTIEASVVLFPQEAAGAISVSVTF